MRCSSPLMAILLFLFFIGLSVAEKAKLTQSITAEGKTFKCKFELEYTNDTVNEDTSTVSCKPKKPKVKKPVDIELEIPGGFLIIGSIKINPTKIDSLYVVPPFDTLDQQFQAEIDKISPEEVVTHHGGCALETKEFEAVKRGYTTKRVKKWEGAKVDWSFVSNGDKFAKYGFLTDAKIGLSEKDVGIVVKAMKQIEKETCIEFKLQKPKKGKEWLAITRESTTGTKVCQAAHIAKTYRGKDVAGLGDVFWGQFDTCFSGAYAYLGANENTNQLFVISAVELTDDQSSVGLVVHELLHNLGVGHTQKRPDQKDNIEVLWDNIKKSESAKFQYSMCTEGEQCITLDTKYDCSSIMHYEDWAFSSNGKPTMKAKDPAKCNLKTDKIRLSETDITLLKKMYCDDKAGAQIVKSPKYPENYPDNQDVTTPIDGGTGNIVEITFTDFDIENHATCASDYVKITDDDGSVLLKESCGKTKPEKITSKSQKVKVVFHSDGTTNAKGFRAEWKATKKATAVDGNWSGWSSWSPCSNNKDGKSTCVKKQTRDCNNPAASNGGKACAGDEEKKADCTASDLSDATKHTDCVRTGGWSKYGTASACNSECKATKTRTCDNPKPFNSKACDGETSETEACTGGDCSSSTSGTITSPNYPKNYPNSKDDSKVLQVADGSKVELKFTSFALEADASCGWDYVEVLDTDGKSLAKKCGTTTPDPIVSSGNKLTVKFHSDDVINAKGYSADWKKVDATSSGLIKSPNYPKNYPDKASETYTLTVTSGKIQLTFTDFNVEAEANCAYDYVQVLDTDGTTSLKKLCGSSQAISPITSTGNKMIVKFVSDYYINKKGFSATWKMVA